MLKPVGDTCWKTKFVFPLFIIVIGFLVSSCWPRDGKEEQIRIEPAAEITEEADTGQSNSIRGNAALSQLLSTPNSVVLTGLPQHRLVTVYKAKKERSSDHEYKAKDYYYYDGYESDRWEHFMPGLDLISGYRLLNVGHYDMKAEQLNFLFDHPVLIRSLYYPSFEQDSIDKKPITRDYYLVSVYDADTNQDSLINRADLRRFYHFDATATQKTQLVPSEYSVVRSQYDIKNDVMYIFARLDSDKNGIAQQKEPVHIFWIDLKKPAQAKRLY